MGELGRRIDRLEETLIREWVEQKAKAAIPLLEQLGIPPEDWPAIRQGMEAHARWELANPHPTEAQVEAEIQQVAAAQAAELGCTPEGWP